MLLRRAGVARDPPLLSSLIGGAAASKHQPQALSSALQLLREARVDREVLRQQLDLIEVRVWTGLGASKHVCMGS